MRTSEKAVSESETASVTASRLTFYRTLDSLSRQFHLSADSIIMIFATSPESPREFPSGMECPLETPSDSQSISHNPARKRIRNASRSESALRPSQSIPKSLKIYGLHIADNSEEKSVAHADLKDSVALATQSQKNKSAKKQSSKPSSTPYFILIIFIITIVIYVVYRLRRII
jgi:preprotein translocase subunit SecF